MDTTSIFKIKPSICKWREAHNKPNFMKSRLIILFILGFGTHITAQSTILYDLDTYKRVDIAYRTSFFTPDLNLSIDTTLNSPGVQRNYAINLGGRYTDNQIINDAKNQKTKYTVFNLNLNLGKNKLGSLSYEYNYDNRSYNESSYFKNGFYIKWDHLYNVNFNFNRLYRQSLDLSYDLGFGFGRLEVINNAWHGARILEELQSKNLLTKIPSLEEMKLFFDLIGDVQFERVMDRRLASMYRVEKIIEYIEQNEWIEKGSVPAFVTIYDAYRYERFFFRQSGERLEFTLTPTVLGNISKQFGTIIPISKFIQPGFFGNVEYEIHENGDLAYYTTKLLGAQISYFELFRDGDFMNTDALSANMYFEYRYNYLPSLRTNLMVQANISGGFVYNDAYDATLNMNVAAEYNYYFSPATLLKLIASIYYADSNFQVGDYQPRIQSRFFIQVVHAFR